MHDASDTYLRASIIHAAPETAESAHSLVAGASRLPSLIYLPRKPLNRHHLFTALHREEGGNP